VAALRAAFVETMQDPAYVADARKRGLDATTWQTGEVIQQLIDQAFSLPPGLIERAKAAMDLPRR
jgi:hypothetical protein